MNVSTYLEHTGPLPYSALSAFSACTGLIPTTALNLAAGPLFGLWWGTILYVGSATVGCVGSLLLVRSALRPCILKCLQRYESKWQALNGALQSEGPLLIVTLFRLSPAVPVTVASFILGMTSVGLVPYTAGTLLGLTPFSFVYVYGVTAGLDMASSASGGDMVHNLLVIAGCLVTVALTVKISQLAQRTLDRVSQDARGTLAKELSSSDEDADGRSDISSEASS